MKIAFIVDPLDKLKAYKDSSVAMMRAAQARGHQVFAVGREDLSVRDGLVGARATPLRVSADDKTWYEAGAAQSLPLNALDAVLMRQDPPFDAEYVAATWILERAVAQGARVFNDPRAIRDHSEKVSITEFPEFTPTTLVARAAGDLNAFIDELEDVILKPLDGMGGSGIFRVRHDDPNRNTIIETLTANGTRSIMAQRFIPAISEGDKRVLVIGGAVIPYALARIPKAGETRGNLAAGGRGVVMPLSTREREVAEALAPRLWERGLLIVGLDLIGGQLTEINVTSPTCMVEIAHETDCDPALCVIQALDGQG
ncbi:MAG: glutathione synthase [Candidatus Dactylopiibacterium carminicum]|uniref:Glutathione synthetase n=1 Tax=Candidatus Dactylopiibacterium carminicum TaxID=857335 RepID=A0A272EWW7_9RHOO|nr:glutathione synthase [Candidatus Dactylopiibacterium carminicum]KAF7600011.1 glutathione synthase [Candidatus Dactylopiibacterium carminicum]PAS94599.1 MAG: glutathione synthase [Candidatus Dactylopiibacterium carminicum]PAS97638.1 MAG: glutathione synthase [Candidatus Dactylopiibacterium carminicum]PAT00016.1 MAG: glutathione synthase [Candidatus Dactylopiibacterium carminicum]